jgi:hypothetical protein
MEQSLWRPDCIRSISWNHFRYKTHQGEIHFDFRNDVSIAPLYSDPRFDAFVKHAGVPPRPTPTLTKYD